MTRTNFYFAFLCLAFLVLITSCTKEDNLTGSTRNNTDPSILTDQDFFASESTGSGYVPGGEGYNEYQENPFVLTSEEATTTFSIDADGGSYSNVRRFLEDGNLPPDGAVRTEEIMNFFQYDYEAPNGNHPIAINGEITACPWTPGNKLLRIGIKGKEITREEMPPANLVFLIDVSGSMRSSNKLELLKEGFLLYADFMRPQDKIAIVTYAGEAGVLLHSTSGGDKQTIKNAINQLTSGGGTNGAGGIIAAYEIAQANFITNGNNRVVLGTDGDFNVGLSSQDELIELIEEKRESNVFLSVLGVGTGNYQDGKMEQLANNGNGNYEYIDDLDQARKVFIDEFGKFYTVAKDVKIQVKFDPMSVYQYRLIGYENRVLNNEDFDNDTKDAGEIGAGQSITALYEFTAIPTFNPSLPIANIDFRYKLPSSDASKLINLPLSDTNIPFQNASENTRFAITAAGFGLMLIDSEYKGSLNWDHLLQWANNAKSFDPNGYRTEFLTWIQTAKELQ